MGEKPYDIALRPDFVFEQFCREVQLASRAHQLPKIWSKVSNWTNLALDIFEKLGDRSGYEVKKEWMLLDETWETRKSSNSFIALALEHENADDIDVLLEDELQKLLDIKAILKVLVYYPEFFDFEQHVEKIKNKVKSQRLKIPDENLLVIMIHPQFLKRRGFLISGYEFDSEGNCSELPSYPFRV